MSFKPSKDQKNVVSIPIGPEDDAISTTFLFQAKMAHRKADRGKQCEKGRNPMCLVIHILRASTGCQGMETDHYIFKERTMTNHLDIVIFFLSKQTMC